MKSTTQIAVNPTERRPMIASPTWSSHNARHTDAFGSALRCSSRLAVGASTLAGLFAATTADLQNLNLVAGTKCRGCAVL